MSEMTQAGNARLPHLCAVAAATLMILLAALTAGCGSAVQSGTNTALDADDLQKMTDLIATSLAADPEVRKAIAEQGSLKVVMLPVQNYMTGEILPEGQKLAFIARVRALLARQNRSEFTWIANKAAYNYARQREIEGLDPGPDPDAMQPRYALQARFDSLTNVDARRRSSSYLCVYELSDLQTREIIWADKYEVHKTAVKGFLD